MIRRRILMKFIHDSNLGFPDQQSQWHQFFSQGKCDIFGTNQVELLSKSLELDNELFAYIPVACLYKVRNVPNIQGLVGATTGKNGAPTTSSVLVVKRGSGFRKLADLKGGIYGRINQYCTSSYYAPAIHLSENGFNFHDFFGKVLDVPVSPGNWQNQIDQVIHGSIDATMVDENTWLASSKNSEQTQIIARAEGLPCPIIVSKSIEDSQFLNSFRQLLLDSPREQAVMFSGFSTYDENSIKLFFGKVSKAFQSI